MACLVFIGLTVEAAPAKATKKEEPFSWVSPLANAESAKKTLPPTVKHATFTLEVKLSGAKATVKIGDAPAKTYEHPSLARAKANLSVGFAFGAMSVKDFAVTK